MFVVVFLVDPKVHIVVAEEFIFNLSQQSLKNVGKNSNFKYTVPNFNLVKSTEFPPIGEACFVGKLKRFFGEYFEYKYSFSSI